MLLNLENIEFAYEPQKTLFSGLNFSVERGKIIAVIGESGCGKTTLLSLVYGLLNWQSGKIIFDGTERFGPKGNLVPGEPDMKLVAQNFDLLDHARVYENVGKFISNIDQERKKEKIHHLLDIVEMDAFYNSFPKRLSGGQQQRIAIARSLAQLPKLLLLDEPFNSLDFSRKSRIRERLFEYVRNSGISLMISTHNISEIMPWVDEVVVLENGVLIQQGQPENVYHHPKNEYVARLFGEVNILNQEDQERLHTEKWFYFPRQIRINGQGRSADVIQSGFSGGFYRNILLCDNKKLISYSDDRLSGTVNITFSEE